MYFFIDTANMEKIRKAKDLGIIDGVTTNPSLIAKENIIVNRNIFKHYQNICSLVEKDVSVEVISTDFYGIVKEAEFLVDLHPHIVVKITMNMNGLKAVRYFYHRNVKTNCTLVFSLSQAILAAKAGASYVQDISYNSLKDIRLVYNNYGFRTKILAASILNPMHIVEYAKIGIDAISTSLETLKACHYPKWDNCD